MHHIPGGGLHPRVGHDDPQRAEVRPKHHQERGEQPHPRPKAIASEQHQTEEAAFEEESENPFGCQQAAKNIAHKARIIGPVHPKFKFLHDASSHPHCEDQAVNLHPEECQAPPFGILGADVDDADHHQHQP